MPLEPSSSKAGRSNLQFAVKLLVTAGLALGFAVYVYPRLAFDGWAIMMKLRGHAPNCSWSKVTTYYGTLQRFADLQGAANSSVSIQETDEGAGLDLVHFPFKSFWVPHRQDGKFPLAYLIAEHNWLAENNPNEMVHNGNIVLDCGAHVGIFTYTALRRGAATVVAIEPDPHNAECLQRNFKKEIVSLQVILVQKGVWSQDGQLVLYSSSSSSALSTVTERIEGEKVVIQVVKIDTLVDQLNLPRIDFIKMDIEGAERDALKGAIGTLRRWKPRLMIDAYHRADDMEILPSIIRQANPGYRMICGPCQGDRPDSPSQIIPHSVFFN